MKRFLLIALAGSLSLLGQTVGHSVGAPALGFLTGKDSASVEAVLGIPGAARLGASFGSSSADGFFVSPGSRYVLAAQTDGELGLALLHPAAALANGLVLTPVSGALTPDLVAFSPTGCTAALYARGSSTVQVITGLPDAPQVSRSLVLADALTRLAVSDDGTQLAGATESGSVVSLPEHVLLSDTPGVVFAFAPKSDDPKILKMTGIGVISADGSTALVAGDGGAHSVSAVDLASGKANRLAVDGNVIRLRRLAERDIYLLTFDDGSNQLLTWRSGKMATYFIGVSGNVKGSN